MLNTENEIVKVTESGDQNEEQDKPLGQKEEQDRPPVQKEFQTEIVDQQSSQIKSQEKDLTAEKPIKKGRRIIGVAVAVIAVFLVALAVFKINTLYRPAYTDSEEAWNKEEDHYESSEYADGGNTLNADPSSGMEEMLGKESAYKETAVVSTESAITTQNGVTVEFGTHNAAFVRNLNVTEYAPDTSSIQDGVRTCYDISADDLHEFDCFFDITLPYDPSNADPEAEEESVFAEYLNEESGEWELIYCDVDTDNHQVIIHTDHLSKFAPVSVKNKNAMYAKAAMLGSLYIDDDEALKDINRRLEKAGAEYKEDPVAMAFFYKMLYEWVGAGSGFTLDSYEIQETVKKVTGDESNNTFNDILGWISGFAYDIGTFTEIIPNSTYTVGNVSYSPAGLFEASTQLATFINAASLAEKTIEDMEQNDGKPSQGTVMDIYKWGVNYGFSYVLGQLGASFGSLYALPVMLVDYSITKVADKVQDAEDDAMSKALYYYYKTTYGRPFLQKNEKVKVSKVSGYPLTGKKAGVVKESWETRLIKMTENNEKKHDGDPAILNETIRSAMLKDMNDTFDYLYEKSFEGDGELEIAIGNGVPQNEMRNLWASIKDLKKKRKAAVVDKAIVLLTRDMQPCLLEVAKHQRLVLRKHSTGWANDVRKRLCFKHTIIVEEVIEPGKESVYAGAKVKFVNPKVPWASMASGKELVEGVTLWEGELDSEGGLIFSFNTFAYLQGGVPSKMIVQYDTDKSMEVDFKIENDTTVISIGDMSMDGFWSLVNTESDEGKNVARDAANGVGKEKVVIEPGRYIESSEAFYADMTITPIHWCIQSRSKRKITYTVPMESYAPGSKIAMEISQSHHVEGYKYSFDDAEYGMANNDRGERVYVKSRPGPTIATDNYEMTTQIGIRYDDIGYKSVEAKGNTTVKITVPTLNEVEEYAAAYNGMLVDEEADHYFTIDIAGTKFIYKWVQ